jgi:hypothetical protein
MAERRDRAASVPFAADVRFPEPSAHTAAARDVDPMLNVSNHITTIARMYSLFHQLRLKGAPVRAIVFPSISAVNCEPGTWSGLAGSRNLCVYGCRRPVEQRRIGVVDADGARVWSFDISDLQLRE